MVAVVPEPFAPRLPVRARAPAAREAADRVELRPRGPAAARRVPVVRAEPQRRGRGEDPDGRGRPRCWGE